MTAYDAIIDEDTPAGHWKLGESSNVGLTARVGPSGTYINSAGGITYSVTGLALNNGGDTAVTFIRSAAGRAEIAQTDAQTLLDSNPGFTLECWVTPTTNTAQSSNQNLMSRVNYGLYLTTDNKPAIFYGAAFSVATATNALVAGTTYHLAYTFNGTTHIVYQNGTSVINVTGTRVVGGKLAIAGYPDLATDTANVTMDEAAVYTAGLSSTRASVHFNGGVSNPDNTTKPALVGMFDPDVRQEAWF